MFARPCGRVTSRDPRARPACAVRAPRTGKLETSPAAKTSSRPATRPNSSTTTPLSTSRPAADGRSVSARCPRPAGRRQLRSSCRARWSPRWRPRRPRSPRQHLDATCAVLVGHKGRQLGRQHPRRDPALRKDDGHPAAVRRQRRWSSEPMKPPPITTALAPSCIRARAALSSSSVRK